MSRGLRAVGGITLIVVGYYLPAGPWKNWAIATGISLVVGAALEKTPARVRRLLEQSVMVRSAVVAQEIVYGETRKSGVVTWYDANGTNNKYLWFVVTVAEHEIDSFSSLWIDEVEIDITDAAQYGSDTDRDGVTDSDYVLKSEFLDGDGYPLVKAGFYTGVDAQVADPDLVASSATWTSAHKGQGVCYFWVRLEVDTSKGGTDPESPANNVWAKGWPRDLSVTLKGAKVYDPRKDNTSAAYDASLGVTTHRVDTASTWAWSDNSVLCRADYMRSDRFGPGFTSSDVDWTVVGTQAAIADGYADIITKTAVTISALASDNSYNDSGSGFLTAGFGVGDYIDVTGFTGNAANNLTSGLITAVTATKITIGGTDGDVIVDDAAGESVTIVGTQKRYTLNGIVTTSDTPRAIVADMQTADHGTTLFLPGGIQILVGAWDASSHSLDETWLEGQMVATSALPTDNAYNAVRGQYLAAHKDWTLIGFTPVTSSAYETEDGIGRQWSDIALGFTSNEYMAQRLAIIELKKSRQQSTLLIDCNFRAELVQLWEVVTIDMPGIVAKTYRCIAKTAKTDGVTTLTLREEVATDWTYTIPDLATLPIVPTVTRGASGPATCTGLTASTAANGILLEWVNPGGDDFLEAELYSSATNDRTGISTAITSGRVESYLDPQAEGTALYYWLVARGKNGLVSAWEPVSSTGGVLGTAGAAGADGTDAITWVMSNQSSGISATSAGVVVLADLAGTGTTLEFKEGETALGFTTGAVSAGKFRVLNRATRSPAGMTMPALTGTGTDTATAPSLTGWSDTTATTGYIDWSIVFIRVGGATSEYLTIRQSFTITPAGAAGTPADASLVSLQGAYVNKVTATPTAAAVRWGLSNTGATYYEYSVSGATTTNIDTWLLSGSPVDYDVRATLISGTVPTSGTMNTWQTLNSALRYWDNLTPSAVDLTSTISVQVRLASTGEVLDTCVVTLRANETP